MKKAISIILVFFLCCGCFFSLGNSFVFADSGIIGGDSFDTAPLLTEQISSVILTFEQNWDMGWELWAPKGHIFKFIPSKSEDYTIKITQPIPESGVGFGDISVCTGQMGISIGSVGINDPYEILEMKVTVETGKTYYIDFYATETSDCFFTIEFDKPLLSPKPEMMILVNDTEITDGDNTPDISDGTDFGKVNIFEEGVTRTYTIKNGGMSPLVLSGEPIVSISSDSEEDYEIIQPSSNTIAAGGSTTFTVTFNPSTIGTSTAMLSIVNNDSDENPYNFSIQGSGSTSLEQVSNVVLSNTGVATWNDISNESSYDIQLYKNGVLQGDVVNVGANTNSYDFLSAMRAAGGGTYTVKVTAKGDGSTYSDGLQSEVSSAQTVIQLEPVSSGLTWSGDVAHWDLVSNAVSYDVQLYKNGNPEGGAVNVLAENVADGVDFTAVIEAAGDGTYTYKVTAKGNDTLILDGAPSDFSNDKIQTTESTIDVTMTASPNSVEISKSFNQIFTLNIRNDTVAEEVYAEDLSLSGVFSSLNIGEVNYTSTTVTASVYGTLSNAGVGTITLNADKLAIRTSPLSAEIMVAARSTYTVTYDGNGAISGTVPKDNNSYKEGDTVTVLGNTGNLLKTGYTLIGWNTKIDGSGTNYAAGESFNMSAGNVTLYAKWKIKEYTVTFKDYDGRILEIQTVEHGSNATAPDSPTRNGYTFTGWNTSFTNVTSDLIVTAAYNKNNSSTRPNKDRTETESTSASTLEPASKQTEPGITVIVNGKEQTAGTELVKEENGEKTVELRVEAETLSNKIDEVLKEKEANGKATENVVEIMVAAKDANNIKSILTGDMVKKMEESNFILAVNAGKIDYIIPAKEIGIEQVAINLGIKPEALKEIEVEVQMEKINEAKVKEIMEKAKTSGYDIIFPPVEFRVVAKSKSGRANEIKVSKFSSYVQRVMEIPEGIEPDKITTGIIYNSDGTFSHIPTSVFKKDGKWYAKLNSLTNSSYSVITNPVTVKSVENHWSKEYVNDMASRLVIKSPETFIPDENITRSDFAEYITKALGIYRTGVAETGKFTDVTLSHKASDAITIAAEYGIIKGYPDGTFRPDSKISREQAMVMYAKAMDIAGLKEADNNRIESYTDKEEIGAWAFEAVKKTVSVGVFNGRTANAIDPKGTFTYAEAATTIRNLLTEAGLINK